jgi:hypothetical protein
MTIYEAVMFSLILLTFVLLGIFLGFWTVK